MRLVVIDGADHWGAHPALGHPKFLRSMQEFLAEHSLQH
jgi:hypothetical protein